MLYAEQPIQKSFGSSPSLELSATISLQRIERGKGKDAQESCKYYLQQKLWTCLIYIRLISPMINEDDKPIIPISTQHENTVKTEVVENHDEQSNKLMPTSKDQSVRRYGNYVTFIDKSYLTITFGPDYLCFLPTFIIFAVFAFLLIRFINNNSTNVYFIIITNIICIGQPLSYLIVAISDPGIAHPLTESDKLKHSKTSFCRKCRFDVPQKTFHCTYCDVCIEGYDHHCPWTSKCIGKNNLIKFYIFLFWTPVFIVYSAFAFGFTVDDAASKETHLRRFGN